jgi:carboxymethylenebutenolidase
VIERGVEIRTPDGVAGGFLYQPNDSSDWPGVIHLTDIGGIRESHRGMAQRLASEGYSVLLPNVFYRTGEPPIFDPPFKMGDERSTRRMGEITAPLTAEAMEADATAYIEFLDSQDGVSAGPIGVVGYCYTGAMAMRTAAVLPERIAAAASFHGGRLYTDAPTSPHLLLPRIQARLYFGHASNDRGMAAEAIEKLEAALKAWGGKYESEVYSAAHGWTVPDSPAYNQAEAERAFRKLTQLISETLK